MSKILRGGESLCVFAWGVSEDRKVPAIHISVFTSGVSSGLTMGVDGAKELAALLLKAVDELEVCSDE